MAKRIIYLTNKTLSDELNLSYANYEMNIINSFGKLNNLLNKKKLNSLNIENIQEEQRLLEEIFDNLSPEEEKKDYQKKFFANKKQEKNLFLKNHTILFTTQLNFNHFGKSVVLNLKNRKILIYQKTLREIYVDNRDINSVAKSHLLINKEKVQIFYYYEKKLLCSKINTSKVKSMRMKI